jgi:hypothetical protein
MPVPCAWRSKYGCTVRTCTYVPRYLCCGSSKECSATVEAPEGRLWTRHADHSTTRVCTSKLPSTRLQLSRNSFHQQHKSRPFWFCFRAIADLRFVSSPDIYLPRESFLSSHEIAGYYLRSPADSCPAQLHLHFRRGSGLLFALFQETVHFGCNVMRPGVSAGVKLTPAANAQLGKSCRYQLSVR